MLTDNKNRTVGELRHLLEKHAGNLAAANAVAWMFTKKGYIVVEKAKADEEKLMSAVLEAGADDLRDDDDNWEVFCSPEAFPAVKEAVKRAKAGKGPTLVECKTYRFRGHHEGDPNLGTRYRTKEEMDKWRERWQVKHQKVKTSKSQNLRGDA